MQVTLQFYFHNILQYNLIKLTKLRRQNVKLKYLEDLKQLVIKTHTAEEIIEVFSFGTVQAKVLKAAIKELLSKTTG